MRQWLLAIGIALVTLLVVVNSCTPPQPQAPSPVPEPQPIPKPIPSPPSPIPQPAPTQTEKGLIFLSDSAYRDSNGYLHVIGEVRNDAKSNAKQIKISVSLLDNQGNITATRANLSYLSLLEPQQRSPFDVIFQEVSDRIPNYQMELSWQATNETPKTRMQIQQISTHIDEDGYYWVNGEVKNIDSQTSDLIAIIGTFYDSAGKVVAVASGLPDVVPLAPGKSSSFSLAVEVPKDATIQESSVQAEAY
jgi:hypothetical protein